MHYQCIIFDWDGTVMDSVPKIVNTIHLAATDCGLERVTDEQAKNIIGLSLEKAMLRLFPHHPDKLQQLVAAYKHIYKHVDTTPTPLFNGVTELLKQLKQQGKHIAVATGKSRVGLDRLLAESGLQDYFVITRTACEAQSKPHPDMLEQILQQLQLVPQQAVMVGDTLIDMELAQRAGVDAIGVTMGVASREILYNTHAKHICDNYQQLAQLLLTQDIDTEIKQHLCELN